MLFLNLHTHLKNIEHEYLPFIRYHNGDFQRWMCYIWACLHGTYQIDYECVIFEHACTVLTRL